MRKNRFPQAIVLVMLVVAKPAHASPASEEYHRAAVKAFDQHDYEAARTLWLHALSLDPAPPKYLWNLAVTEEKGAHFADALMHFRRFLNRPDATEEEHKKARKLVDEAERRTGHVVLDAPAGATVFVDGRETPLYTDKTLDMEPGAHTIEARSGNSSTSSTVEPKAGETLRTQLRFDAPLPPASAPPSAPETAPTMPHLPADAQTEAPSWWTGPRYVGLGLAGLAVVGLVTGTASRIAYGANQTDAAALRSSISPGACTSAASPPACATLLDKINSGSTNATFSTVGFVVGGIAAAGSVGLLVFGGGGTTSVRTGTFDWTPVVGLGSVGVAGHFE